MRGRRGFLGHLIAAGGVCIGHLFSHRKRGLNFSQPRISLNEMVLRIILNTILPMLAAFSAACNELSASQPRAPSGSQPANRPRSMGARPDLVAICEEG
jgi:hypothetical protein